MKRYYLWILAPIFFAFLAVRKRDLEEGRE